MSCEIYYLALVPWSITMVLKASTWPESLWPQILSWCLQFWKLFCGCLCDFWNNYSREVNLKGRCYLGSSFLTFSFNSSLDKIITKIFSKSHRDNPIELAPQEALGRVHTVMKQKVKVKVTQLCASLWPHGLYSPWNFPGQNAGVDRPSLLQGIFPTQESNTRSPTLQVDSLPAKPQGKPKNTGVDSLSLLRWIFPTQESNWGLLNCRWILY